MKQQPKDEKQLLPQLVCPSVKAVDKFPTLYQYCQRIGTYD